MKNIIILAICLFIPLVTFSQINNEKYFQDAAKGLGFFYGVELSLDIIVNKYPDLSGKALMAKMNFGIAHKKSKENLEEIISSKFEIDDEELRMSIVTRLKSEYKFDEISYEEANNFLNNFEEERVRGNHEVFAEFIRILLSHNPKYTRFPIKEFLDGFRQKLNTDNHSKSKGLNLSIEYPKSWIYQEGKRPNIICLIKNPNEKVSMTIVIKDILKTMGEDASTLTKEDLDYFKSNEFVEEVSKDVFTYSYGKEYISGMGLEDVDNYRFEEIKIDGQPAMIASASGKINQGIVNMQIYTINYLVSFENYVISLGIMIEGGLLEDIEKYDPLCRLIANSLILKDKWK